ncbi:MAG: response regulator [Nitrospirae bacterium]|nr:response regulator [Nitrospirota bacterium]
MDNKEIEKKYRQLFELNHAGIWCMDKDNYTTMVNPRMASMLGYGVEEMPGRNLFTFVHENDIKALQRNIERLKPGTNEQIDIRLINSRGKTLYTVMDFSPEYGQDGSYAGLIAGVVDISVGKMLENQLRHSQKMESIGQLAGGIAHDFNNILAAISNYIFLMKLQLADIESDDLVESVDEIEKAAERAANLIKSMLVFSRKHVFEFRAINLAEVLAMLRKFLKRIMTADIDLEVNVEEDSLYINADITQIEMMFINLAANARDAMPEGGTLTIELSKVRPIDVFEGLSSVEKADEYALIRVIDTGTGIDKETKERIFDPFFTTKDVGKGTGLGLATVYGIVKQHKGYIGLDTELGKGTTFFVYLPITEDDSKEERLLLADNTESGKGTILMAEDDPYLREVTAKMLTRAGYTVITAKDGEDVVHKYKANKVDLILMDLIMPKNNGKQAYEEIRQLNSDVKVIFISGYIHDVLMDKVFREEELQYMAKPVSAVSLLSKIREMLAK